MVNCFIMNRNFNIEENQLSESLANSSDQLKNYYRKETDVVVSSPQHSDLLGEVKAKARGIEQIPEINDSIYSESLNTGNREIYENSYDARRVNLSIAAFLVISGDMEYLPIVEKYLIAICDERTWVIPAHDGRLIDIYSADTTLTLAETVAILRDKLSPEVIERVYREVRLKIFEPYEKKLEDHIWYDKGDNWTSVCNSCIGSAYLLLEPDNEKKNKGIIKVIDGLNTYICKSFKEDGGTDEGVLYWNYGMGMFTVFSEHLFNATNGAINLFANSKIKRIAEFPANMILGDRLFISFSDAYEHGTQFHPGYIQKIASRADTPRLLGLLSYKMQVDCYELPNLIRYCSWWDGKQYPNPEVESILLPDLGIAKLVSIKQGYPIIVSTKAGNNGENHNHNDIGSFILTVDSENFLTDPGPGKYSGDYFSEKRYENVFANSYGHSVPVIDGLLQKQGGDSYGTIDVYSTTGETYVLLNLTNAYKLEDLKRYTREIFLNDADPSITLTDSFEFTQTTHSIQEAFVTYKEVKIIDDQHIIIVGENHSLEVSIEVGKFEIEQLKKESLDNEKDQTLKRITVTLSHVKKTGFVINFRVK